MADQNKLPDSGHNAFRVEVVTTPQQFLHVMGVRAICYTEDTNFPMDQAIDGNDYQCTHVIAYLGDEPVGAGRIRWFKDFAKIERTAFRPRFRDMSYLKIYANFVFCHIARKGYSRAITHASPKYARLWRIILGMKPVDKPAATYFGEEYVELVKELVVPRMRSPATAASNCCSAPRAPGTGPAATKRCADACAQTSQSRRRRLYRGHIDARGGEFSRPASHRLPDAKRDEQAGARIGPVLSESRRGRELQEHVYRR